MAAAIQQLYTPADMLYPWPTEIISSPPYPVTEQYT